MNITLENTAVIVPTYQAGKHANALVEALKLQAIHPSQVLVVDSSSTDGSTQIFRNFGARVVVIPQKDFNHGGTRRYATELEPTRDFYIFLTQDCIPRPGALLRLVSSFREPIVGMSYGRQLPVPHARAIERHARLFNYTPRSEIRDLSDRARMGVKSTFCSDSFAAYRREALSAIGGFPEDVYFGEDQILGGRMLLSGWKLAYCADAEGVHSHAYSLRQEFRRYFDVGVFHARNTWLLQEFGAAEGEGLKFVLSELKYLIRHEPLSIPSAIARTFVKYAGYKAGRMESKLSLQMKKKLSANPSYWK